MSRMFAIPKPQLRYEGELVREIHYFPTVTHRLEWTIWKQSTVDCLSVFVKFLTNELLRPRNQLMYILESILLRLEVPGNETPQGQMFHPFRRYETVDVDMMMQTSTAQQRGGDFDLFIYGHDPQKIEAVLKNALHFIIMEHQEIEIPTLTLHGRKIGHLTSSHYREMLAAECSKHEDPKLLLIILEEFTANMFSSFKGSGFVDAKRCSGITIITICWSTDYLNFKHTHIWREFAYNVFVPNHVDETPWIPENDELVSGRAEDNMIVYKSWLSTANVAMREDLYAPVHDVVRESVQRKGNEEIEEHDYQPSGEYVKLEPPQCVDTGARKSTLGHCETTANSIPVSFLAGSCNDNSYPNMQPMWINPKPPTPVKPIVNQPRKMSESSSVFGGQNVVVRNKTTPDCVGSQQHAEIDDSNAPDNDAKKKLSIEHSFCEHIANCIVTVYAFLLD